MKYQLVLQFQAESVQEFDELVVLEDLLVENLPSHSEVDGHDFGSGEFNIFILTDQPKESFHAAEKTIQPHRQPADAYRNTADWHIPALFRCSWIPILWRRKGPLVRAALV